MERRLTILMVEDSGDDAELIAMELRHSGYDPLVQRVDNAQSMTAALSEKDWDVVISDYAMPQFSGLKALELLRATHLDIPFIIVSGTIGEDVAVAAMRAGAHDYVMKDNLARLGPAIRRELKEARVRHERRLTETILFQEKERALVTLQSIGDGVITTDVDGHVVYMNPVAENLTGWSATEARAHSLDDVLHLVDELSHQRLSDPVGCCLRQGNSICLPSTNVLMPRGSQQEYVIEVTASPVRGHDGTIIGCVLVLHDATELRGMARQLSYQATHDALTGLINRREFEARLELALESTRQEGRRHAVCYLDLDQFKLVNDTRGHVAGDELLKQLATQLQAVIRETDTLARLGGDEFGVLLEDCDVETAVTLADELRNITKSFRFIWGERVFEVGVSIGLVPITADSGSVTDVLKAADSACYVAKDHGRNRVHVFQSDDADLAQRHGEMQWVSEITLGIEEHRFELYSQPIVPLNGSGDQGMHYELLIRLRDQHNNLVLPAEFIPAAERYNLMPRLDRWVVATVFDALSSLHKQWPDFLSLHKMCAINLSGTTLSDEQFLDFLQEQLRHSGLPPQFLCFEITETAAIANLARAGHLIGELRKLGCRFALDDFGTGLSSFSYLKTLPVDYLKIDGSFVRDMLSDPMDKAIVQAVGQIGRVLGIQTIAESVEDDGLLVHLREMGVDYAQGYAIQRPRPLQEQLAELTDSFISRQRYR